MDFGCGESFVQSVSSQNKVLESLGLDSLDIRVMNYYIGESTKLPKLAICIAYCSRNVEVTRGYPQTGVRLRDLATIAQNSEILIFA